MLSVCKIFGHKKTLLDARLIVPVYGDAFITVRFECARCLDAIDPPAFFDIKHDQMETLEKGILERMVRA